MGNDFNVELLGILAIIFGVIGAIGVPFSIFLAFNLANAKDEQQRATAKKRFTNVLASTMIIFILAGLLGILEIIWTPGHGLDPRYQIQTTAIQTNRPTQIMVRRDNFDIRSIAGYTLSFEIPDPYEVTAAGAILSQQGVITAANTATITVQVTIVRSDNSDFLRTLIGEIRILSPGDPGLNNSGGSGDVGGLGERGTILGEAHYRIGSPRVWGGRGTNNPHGGYDSSGLVIAVFRDSGIALNTSGSSGRVGENIFNNLNAAGRIHQTGQAGDIIFWRNAQGHIQHSGIFLGGSTKIHSPGPGGAYVGQLIPGWYVQQTTFAGNSWGGMTIAGFGRL